MTHASAEFRYIDGDLTSLVEIRGDGTYRITVMLTSTTEPLCTYNEDRMPYEYDRAEAERIYLQNLMRTLLSFLDKITPLVITKVGAQFVVRGQE